MASSATANGNPATSGDTESAAQKLQAKHAAMEPHKVEIEEVIDEEDLAHPPPSAGLHANADSSLSMSDVAKGKQKAETEQSKKPKGPAFDVKSEEAFPALGGPTPRAATSASQTWGKMPAAIHTNGNKPPTNGGSNGTSRAPTPASVTSRSTMIPGWESQKVELFPQQIAKGQFKKPLPEIIRDINKRSKATITMTAGQGSILVFEARGPKDAAASSLKELVGTICAKVGDYSIVFTRSIAN
jgi:hypothetical protein